MVRIPCESSLGSARWLDYSTVVVGSIDVTGVRAAVLPWEGWSSTSPAWMPFVPFASGTPAVSHADGAGIAPDCGPGSLDGLIDLLLDLSDAEVDCQPRACRAASSKSRLRPVTVVGNALVQLSQSIDRERRAQLESLKPA